MSGAPPPTSSQHSGRAFRAAKQHAVLACSQQRASWGKVCPPPKIIYIVVIPKIKDPNRFLTKEDTHMTRKSIGKDAPQFWSPGICK